MDTPMPPPEVYLAEYRYMPWGEVIDLVYREVISCAPVNARVIDLMCGPGLLAGHLVASRPDLVVSGIDIDPTYVAYAQDHFPDVKFVQGDVLVNLPPAEQYQVVICTGSLHHLPFEDQSRLIQLAFDLLVFGGYFILAEPCIGSARDEMGRQLRAAQLGYKYLCEVIRRGAPKAVLEATADILKRDVVLDGEYKTTPDRLITLIMHHTSHLKSQRVWPRDTHDRWNTYGDYIFTARKGTHLDA